MRLERARDIIRVASRTPSCCPLCGQHSIKVFYAYAPVVHLTDVQKAAKNRQYQRDHYLRTSGRHKVGKTYCEYSGEMIDVLDVHGYFEQGEDRSNPKDVGKALSRFAAVNLKNKS